MKIRTGLCLSSAMALTLGLTMGSAQADDASLQAQIRLLSAKLQAQADADAELRAQVQDLSAKLQAQAAPSTAAAEKATAAAAEAEKAASEAKEGSKTFLTEGSFPGSYKIPSTNTSVRIGGYVKGDVVYEPDAGNGGVTTQFNSIPLPGTAAAARHNETNITARQTRLVFQSSSPVLDDDLKTDVQADFYGQDGNKVATNSSVLRLRHATGEWKGLLIGMTESNFEDHDAGVESIEFNNTIGRANGIRQPIIQYQHLLGPGRLSVALESPTGDFNGAVQPALNTGMNTISTNNQDKVPDVTAAYMYKDTWGHVQVMGVARDLSVDTGAATVTTGQTGAGSLASSGKTTTGEATAFAGGGGFSTLFFTNKVDGKDNYITAQFAGGQGIGRYIQGVDTGIQAGYYDSTGRVLRTEAAYGFAVAYRNWWSATWRSNIIYGHTHASNFAAMDTADVTTNPTRQLDDVYVNLIWQPAPQVQMGIEYVLGHRVVDGPSSTPVSAVKNANANALLAPGATVVKNSGWGNRIQFGAQYNF